MLGHFLPPHIADALALSPAHFGYPMTEDALTHYAMAGIQIEAARDLHVTLAFLGDAAALRARIPPEALAEYLHAALRGAPPITARIAGLGRFTATPDGAPHALYAAVDAPGLTALRERLCDTLALAGASPDSLHGFTPHITLAYLPPDVPTPPLTLPPLAWSVEAVTLALGSGTPDALHITLPLHSSAPTAPAPVTPLTAPLETVEPLERATERPTPPERLIAALVAAYALSADDIAQLGRRLYAARVTTTAQRLHATLAPFGAHAPSDWSPGKAWLTQAAEASLQTARGIAATYRDDLRRGVIAAAVAWYASHGETWPTTAQLATDAAQWAQARAKWKATQVAAVETRQASQAASDVVAQAIRTGSAALTPEAARSAVKRAIGDAYGPEASELWSLDELQMPQMALAQVIVLPDISSPDDCADWAGNTYAIDEYNDIPIPMHYNCIHEKFIVLGDDITEADDALA